MTKQEIIKYLKENELNIQSDANAAIFLLDLGYSAYNDSDVIFQETYSPIFVFIRYKDQRIFYQIIPQHIFKKVFSRIYSDFLKEEAGFKKIIKDHKNLQVRADKIWQEYKKGKIELKETYRGLVPIYRESFVYASAGEDKGEMINSEIIPEFAIRNKMPLNKTKKMFDVLSHPEQISVISLERKYFLNVCLAFLNNKGLEEKIKEYIDNYFWFKTNFYKKADITKELLIEEVKQEIKDLGKDKIKRELRDFNKGFEGIEIEKEKLLKRAKLSQRDRKDIQFARLIIEWIDIRKEQMLKMGYYVFSVLDDFAKKKGLEYEDMAVLTIPEANRLILGDKKPDLEEISRRKKGGFWIYEKGREAQKYYGKKAEEMLQAATEIKEQEQELKGQIASTGGVKSVRGKIRIVINPEKDPFEKGEILTTSMTRTDFLPLMRKAKAIITNEGGVACHAAIVSRELNIPCIVGTKNATRILKTNDKVNMDLKKGIITKK